MQIVFDFISIQLQSYLMLYTCVYMFILIREFKLFTWKCINISLPIFLCSNVIAIWWCKNCITLWNIIRNYLSCHVSFIAFVLNEYRYPSYYFIALHLYNFGWTEYNVLVQLHCFLSYFVIDHILNYFFASGNFLFNNFVVFSAIGFAIGCVILRDTRKIKSKLKKLVLGTCPIVHG